MDVGAVWPPGALPARGAWWAGTLAQQLPTKLVLMALEQTRPLRPPASGLIIHADRGRQYTGAACQLILANSPFLLDQPGG